MIKETNDFRLELYKKYISTFKKFISSESTLNIKSEYKIYERRYLPLIKGINKEAKIIDLGCGSGYMLQFLKQNGFKNLYGIDISDQQIEKAKSKGFNVEVKNIFDFFKSNVHKYDIVLAFDFVEHFHKEELLDLFSGINEIMSDSGILIIHTPNGQGLLPGRIIYGDLTHLTIFNPNSLTQILRLTGFYNIEFKETGPVSKNLVGFVRLVLWKIIRTFVMLIKIIETGNKQNIYTQDFICYSRKDRLNK